jgi:hypothetical protein
VCELAPLFVVGRAGHDGPSRSGFSLPAVSSTRVRELFRSADDPSARAELSEIVPAAVLEYILAHGLFGAPPTSPSLARPERP